MPIVQERVYNLERIVAELAHAQLRTELTISNLAGEMAEFKNEMAEFKNEMTEFKNEMTEFKNEMRAFKKESNLQWGNLANKLGSIAEDVVAPNIRRLALEQWGFSEITEFITRIERKSRRGKERNRQFDAICACREKAAVCEVKTTPRPEHIDDFAASIREILDFFPEYENCEIIPVFGSWALDRRVRARIAELNLYGVAMGDETMQIVARPGSFDP
jgi:hypothetical protein